MSDLQRLLAEGLVRPPTADVLLARISTPDSAEPKFFDLAEFARLVALIEQLRPSVPGFDATEISLQIDARLARGEGDGWRYDTQPADGEAYKRGLTAIDLEALPNLQRDHDSFLSRFLEELLVEIVTITYSHPEAQASIGYVGYADAKGWSHVGLDEREDWET